MINGCICCMLCGDLLDEVCKLVVEGCFDYLLIEFIGIVELLLVVVIFDFCDEDGCSLFDVLWLDMMVMVVDVINLIKDFFSYDFIVDCGELLGEEDECILVDLLIDQMEFVDVIVLNKVIEVGFECLDQVCKIVCVLNLDVCLIEMDFSCVDVDEIFDMGLFDFDCVYMYFMWVKELYGFENYIFEIEEYGILFFVYCVC